jgi:hypothetical protein
MGKQMALPNALSSPQDWVTSSGELELDHPEYEESDMLNRPFVRLAGDTKITTEFKIRSGQRVEAIRLETLPGARQHHPNTRAYWIYIGKQTCLLFGLT